MKQAINTIFILLLGLASATGCGYRRAGMGEALPKNLRTIAIPPLKNTTRHYEIEQRFTQALVREFVERGKFSIIPKETGADAVLKGEITGVGASPVIYGRDTFGSTFLITIYLKISLVAAKTNQVLYQNDGFIFRDQYSINARVFGTSGRVSVEQVFSEENAAIDRMAKDLAASVVTSVLESF